MKGTRRMLNHQTIEGLYALNLPAMAAGLTEQASQASYQALSFEERLGLLVDRELTERDNRRLARHLKTAKLRSDAVIEDIDFRRRRGLERASFLSLAEAGWVTARHNIAIVGPTGVGKTFLACALANAAIRRGAQRPLPTSIPHARRAGHGPHRRAPGSLWPHPGPASRCS